MQDPKQSASPAKIQQIIGVYDGLSARIADQFGFDWLHVGGYNISGSQYAMPDVGLLTLSENLEAVRKIVQCTNRPVMVDGDDGYGNYLNVMRLVREVERTGASAIHMEDQVLPKKCGHMAGKRTVPTETFVQKVKAFVDTRKTSSCCPDANLNSAISGNSGHDAGPKMAWREGVFDGEEIRAAHPAHAHSRVQGTCRPCRLARGQDDGRTVQAV
jgi:2-methylisocitrate lyase-like PEP mutase family enzyme